MIEAIVEAKIFDTLLEPTFLLDAQGVVIYCNEPAALIADQTVRRILRQKMKFLDLFIFSEPVTALSSLATLTEPSAYQELNFSTPSGTTGKIQITLQNFSGVYLVFFRDVTLEEKLQRKYRAELEQKEDVIKDLQKAQAELQNYSKNLEKMVADRTTELSRLNTLMKALLDSLGQGFFIFDQTGVCLDISTKACLRTIESNPQGKMIWQALNLPAVEVDGFKKWMMTLFSEMLPFEDLGPLGPGFFHHSEKLKIQLQYFPLRSSAGTIDGVVVVATDITDLVKAQREAEVEKAHVKMILSLVQARRSVLSFVRESELMVAFLRRESFEGVSSADELFRVLHTLKGGAGTFSILNVMESCHHSEGLLAQWKKTPEDNQARNQLQQSLKEVVDRYDGFLKEFEELLGNKNKLQERHVEISTQRVLQFANEEVLKASSPQKIREKMIHEFLNEPIRNYFESYMQLVPSLAEKLGKKAAPVKVVGGDLRITPEPYEKIFSCFVHAFRNAVDHGIESPQERVGKGKPEQGQIEIQFTVKKLSYSSLLLIQVSDDGNGIPFEKLKNRLKAKGIKVEDLSRQELLQHVFDSEVTTRDEISELSGRGVGLNALLDAAIDLGGIAWIDTQEGKGTQIFVEVPYFTDPSQLKANAVSAA